MYATDPAGYAVKYGLHLENTQAMVGALNGTQPAPQLGPAQPQPNLNVAPQNHTQGNTDNVSAQPQAGVPASPINGML
ncbi:MAG: hypothetical protein LAN71_17835 [Acidobacteriia bacterium]|nr:hypothetical protein [Terriglobia bacterium]